MYYGHFLEVKSTFSSIWDVATHKESITNKTNITGGARISTEYDLLRNYAEYNTKTVDKTTMEVSCSKCKKLIESKV